MSIYGGFFYGGDTYAGIGALTAFDYELGGFEGRIPPTDIEPIAGSFTFVLGSDRIPEQMHDLGFLDDATVEQIVDLTGVNYIRSIWHVRQPLDMPRKTALTAPAVKFGSVLNPGDTLLGLTTTVPTFVTTDTHRIVRIAGATNGGNNGDKRITGIISSTSVILDSGIVATENPLGAGGGTATLMGAQWEASLTVAGVKRVSRIEHYGESRRRTDMAAHVSKLAGNQTVRFKLELLEEP